MVKKFAYKFAYKLVFSKLVNPQTLDITSNGQIAQSVEQRTENPCVGGSIPPLATTYYLIITAIYPLYLLSLLYPKTLPNIAKLP